MKRKKQSELYAKIVAELNIDHNCGQFDVETSELQSRLRLMID